MKKLVAQSALFLLGVLVVGQSQAGLTLNFFGRSLGKTVNPNLALIDKECKILDDFLQHAQLIFQTDGVVSLFNSLNISQQRPRKMAATKIKKAFNTVLAYFTPEVLENANEQERAEFARLLTTGVTSLVALHRMMMPMIGATLDNREEIQANPTTVRKAQDFFVYMVRPLEDTLNLLIDFAQKEGEIKFFSRLIADPVLLRDQVYVALAAYQSLGIRRGWTLWDITKWAAAGAVVVGTLYIVSQNKSTLSESMNSMIERAKTYAPTWSGFKTGVTNTMNKAKAYKPTWSGIKTSVTSTINKAKSYTPTWSEIKSGMTSAVSTVSGKAQKATDYAKSFLPRYKRAEAPTLTLLNPPVSDQNTAKINVTSTSDQINEVSRQIADIKKDIKSSSNPGSKKALIMSQHKLENDRSRLQRQLTREKPQQNSYSAEVIDLE